MQSRICRQILPKCICQNFGLSAVEELERPLKWLTKLPEKNIQKFGMTLPVWLLWSANATQQHVLEENIDGAQGYASFACYLEEYMLHSSLKGKPHLILQKLLSYSTLMNIHLLIPCSCLDEKYKQVKSITKMGVC